MKLLVLLLSLLISAGICGAAGVTTQTITFTSKALDRPTTYIAALPSPPEAGHRYPVIYLLHGATGSYKDWSEKTTVTLLAADKGFILVMPDGGPNGWYLDSPLVPASQYDSAISRDLVADVDARFPTRADRTGRAIAGLSMGGHGALSLAARHPDVYSSASSMSGILNITAHPGKWELDKILGKQPPATPDWEAHSVLGLAERFTTADVALLFDTGTEDATGAVEDNRALHRQLEQLGVPHIYREFPGKHSWDYWSAHVPEHIQFHLDHLKP